MSAGENVVQERVNALGARIRLIDNRDGAYEDDDSPEARWATECATHGNYCLHATRALAASFLSVSDEWCADCYDIANPGEPEFVHVEVKEEPASRAKRNGHAGVSEGPCEVTGPGVESRRAPSVGCALAYAAHVAAGAHSVGTWYVRELDTVVGRAERNEDGTVDVRMVAS